MKFHQIIWLGLFLLSACSTPTASPAVMPTTSTTRPQVGEYPAPAEENQINTAYPVGDVQSPTSIPPTIDPQLGRTQGRLLLNGKPVDDGIIYLAEIIKDSEGNELVVGFDRESKLRGDLDKSGNFRIVNIPPGRYGIIYDLVTDAVLLNEPGKEISFIVEIAPGQDLNLGDLDFPMLPSRN